MNIFLICGYGIPTDIQQDTNYRTYLHIVFNHMYELAANQSAVVIPCGGSTKCDPPYTGTEAEVIAVYLRELMAREETNRQTSRWSIFPEETSLSTLENLLFAKEIIQTQNFTGPMSIFCEKTRESRVEAFAEKIFGEGRVRVQAIDFDVSKNRYLDPEVLSKKETLALEEGLWTLENPDRIQKHHAFFQKKFEFLRRRQSEGLSHVDAIAEWYMMKEEVMRQLIPDHPLLHVINES